MCVGDRGVSCSSESAVEAASMGAPPGDPAGPRDQPGTVRHVFRAAWRTRRGDQLFCSIDATEQRGHSMNPGTTTQDEKQGVRAQRRKARTMQDARCTCCGVGDTAPGICLFVALHGYASGRNTRLQSTSMQIERKLCGWVGGAGGRDCLSCTCARVL